LQFPYALTREPGRFMYDVHDLPDQDVSFQLASTTSPPSSILVLFIHGQWSNQVVSAECVWNRLLHESAFNVPSGVTIIFLGERLRSRRASYLTPCIVLPRSRCRSAVRFPRLQALSYMHGRSATSARSESNLWPRSEDTAQLP
jgi:hypothetical protein